MAWVPLFTSVNELFVYTDFSQSFSYVDEDPLTSYTVTSITTDRENSLMAIGVDSISGQYDATPHGSSTIYYLNKDGVYNTVSNFEDIQDAYEICSFTPPSIQNVTYNYTVTAEDSNGIGPPVSRTYSVVVTFNWDAGKQALISAVADTRVGR